jgi:hypothetical protein
MGINAIGNEWIFQTQQILNDFIPLKNYSIDIFFARCFYKKYNEQKKKNKKNIESEMVKKKNFFYFSQH